MAGSAQQLGKTTGARTPRPTPLKTHDSSHSAGSTAVATATVSKQLCFYADVLPFRRLVVAPSCGAAPAIVFRS
jgi:hypothetical protein